MRGDGDRTGSGGLGLRLRVLVLTGVWRVVRHEGGGGAHYAGHGHRLHRTVTVQAGQAVVLQVEGDVVNVRHESVRGEVQEWRDILRCGRTDGAGAPAVQRVVARLHSLAVGLRLQVGRPALHFLARQQRVRAAGGLPAAGGQQVEVETDGVGVRVAVQSAGDVVTVRLSGAASVRETSMTLEVGEVDDIDFE